MSLVKLVKRCAQNDRKSQAEVYQIYSGKLFAVCLKYSKNYQEAEDNLQDGFLTIFKKIGQFNHKGSFEGWMKRIMINTALQKYRQQMLLSVITNDIPEDTTVEVNEDAISIDFLLDLIQNLPVRYRMVFNLYVLDGYSHKEISSELKISVGTSKSNLSRARLNLKEKIEKKSQSESIKTQNS